MGKNKRPQSSNISLQNGCMNKILHALDRRQRWQNVRKVLPNKRQGSGKHIIDGGSGEPTTNTTQTLEVHHDLKKNKPHKNEQETAETRSKKFRIRSLISEEMAKRRGTRLLKKKTNKPENDTQSETTKKKRKYDICAAMLTVSYLRQKGLANEKMVTNEDKNQQPTNDDDDDDDDDMRIGLTKSFSFPLLAQTKTNDFEVQKLKNKLRDFKDIQSTKDKFILPMNQYWKDVVGSSKPMLTRPESFTGSASRNEKKKTLKQKIGFVVKVDGKKEKRRILMDAVFHKIPYGRKSSKDPKKVLKTTSTASSDSKTHLKKTPSNSETMSKYRKLLSQTSTRDEKQQHNSSNDHKPKLFVAGDHSFENRTQKRIRSLPNISPYDFTHNHEFPVKPTTEIHLGISGALSSSDQFEIYSERRNVPAESIGESINQQNESEAVVIVSGANLETEKDETVEEKIITGHDYEEQNDHQNKVVVDDQENSDKQLNEPPRVAIEVENDKSFNEILGMFKKVSDERTKVNNENESSRSVVRKVGKNNTTLVDKKPEVVSESSQEKHKLQLSSSYEVDDNLLQVTLGQKESLKTSCSEIEWLMQDSSALISNSQLEDENKQHMYYIKDADENEMIKNGNLESNAEYQFVKQVMEKSGFLTNHLLQFGSKEEEWYSSYQPMDPLLFEEVETNFLQTKLNVQDLDSMKDEEVVQKMINDHHLLLFDLVNEALLEIHNNTTFTCCTHPSTYSPSNLTPMPRLLRQVWGFVNKYLTWKPDDDVITRDLAKGSAWMNLQADAEFVGIQLQELLVDDLLDELVFDDLLM